MSEPSLSITRTDIKRYLGRKMGASLTSSDWTGTEIDDNADDFIESGERNFYYHDMILPGESTVHLWSFLKQTFRQGIVSSQWQYDLPDDFGGFIGSELSFAPSGDVPRSVQLTSPEELYRARQEALETFSYPILAAVETIPSENDRPQRLSLALWPTPTEARTLIGHYNFNPGGITDSTPYPFGGQQHSETLLALCLAATELLDDDEEGPYTQKARRLLAASIYRDRALTTPKYFGKMHDPSCPGIKHPFRYHWGSTNTYATS